MRHCLFRRVVDWKSKTAQFGHFPNLARLLHWSWHRRIDRQRHQEEMKMPVYSNCTQRVLAGFGALAITVMLFANTLATKAAEVQSVAGILA